MQTKKKIPVLLHSFFCLTLYHLSYGKGSRSMVGVGKDQSCLVRNERASEPRVDGRGRGVYPVGNMTQVSQCTIHSLSKMRGTASLKQMKGTDESSSKTVF